MSNRRDGKSDTHPEQGAYYNEDNAKVQKSGSSDAKILAKAYVEYSKNGFTETEKKTLEEMDKLLKGANFAAFDKDSAVLYETDGTGMTYGLLGDGIMKMKPSTVRKK